jgi:hypothetical protein
MLVSRGHHLGWAAGLAITMVATGAGVASYVGLFGFAREHGATRGVAALIPIAFDGVVLAMSLAMRILSKPVVAKEQVGHNAQGMDVATRQAELATELATMQLAKDTEMAKLGQEQGVATVAKDSLVRLATVDAEMAKPTDSEIGEWMAGAELAITEMGQQVAREAEAYVASAPAPTVKDSAKVPVIEASELAMTGAAESGYTLGQISELLGGHYGVSARTIRRQSWWPAVSGRPVSAPPAEGVN